MGSSRPRRDSADASSSSQDSTHRHHVPYTHSGRGSLRLRQNRSFRSRRPDLASTSTSPHTQHRQRKVRSAWTSSSAAAILVSSVLVTSPAMITRVSAAPSAASAFRRTTRAPASSLQQVFDVSSSKSPRVASDNTVNQLQSDAAASSTPSDPSTPQLLVSSTNSEPYQGADAATDDSPALAPSPTPSRTHVSSDATPPSRILQRRSVSSMNDIDDHLPDLQQRWVQEGQDELKLFDDSGSHIYVGEDSTSSPESQRLFARTTPHRYTLPSSYPSSIASSWSRPERSVWFQQKAIIITSIFLAIFIVLFIGAAVFLRERKLDDELDGLEDEEALARIEEQMNRGRAAGSDGGRFGAEKPPKKRRFRIGRKKSDKEMKQVDSSEPSTGSSSAIKRRRHIVSRWTRRPARDSRDSLPVGDDAASIRSGRTGRRVTLGDPSASERVEITYDDRQSASHPTGDESSREGLEPPQELRPRSPPPPHPQSGESGHSGRDNGLVVTSSDGHSPTASALDEPRSTRRALLDDSDFQAADAAETYDDARHMPPAYISSGLAGGSSTVPTHATIAAAIARGDAKRGIPPPEERDGTIPTDVIGAALAGEEPPQPAPQEDLGPTAAHIAIDDKAVLGALSAAASMPSAPSASYASAPAYGSLDATSSGSASGPAPAVLTSTALPGPSAPVLETDDDGFELPTVHDEATGTTPSTSSAAAATSASGSSPPASGSAADEGKGKGKQGLGVLPAPPVAIEPAFSRFDEPYRAAGPPRPELPRSPPSTPGRSSEQPTSSRRSEKQKEAEQELAQLLASRPGAEVLESLEVLDVPQYERLNSFNSASAPPLSFDVGEDADVPSSLNPSAPPTSIAPPTAPEGLPAYERNHASQAPGGSSTPTAPSAPAESDADEQEPTEGSSRDQ